MTTVPFAFKPSVLVASVRLRGIGLQQFTGDVSMIFRSVWATALKLPNAMHIVILAAHETVAPLRLDVQFSCTQNVNASLHNVHLLAKRVNDYALGRFGLDFVAAAVAADPTLTALSVDTTGYTRARRQVQPPIPISGLSEAERQRFILIIVACTAAALALCICLCGIIVILVVFVAVLGGCVVHEAIEDMNDAASAKVGPAPIEIHTHAMVPEADLVYATPVPHKAVAHETSVVVMSTATV